MDNRLTTFEGKQSYTLKRQDIREIIRTMGRMDLTGVYHNLAQDANAALAERAGSRLLFGMSGLAAYAQSVADDPIAAATFDALRVRYGATALELYSQAGQTLIKLAREIPELRQTILDEARSFLFGN